LPLMMFWKSSKTLNCSAMAILTDDQIRVESERVKNRKLVGVQVGSQFFVLYSRVGPVLHRRRDNVRGTVPQPPPRGSAMRSTLRGSYLE
jgi:hypothetical protein